MLTCKSCRLNVRGDPDKAGARCPSCRMPLYERPESVRKPPPSMSGLGDCQVHPDKEATGRCQRCKQLFCTICRTRWRDELLCLPCLNQVLDDKEPTEAEVRVQGRRVVMGFLFALLGWILLILSGYLVWTLRDGGGNRDLAVGILIFFLLSFLPAVLGLSQAIAALCSRSKRVLLATWSLVLTGLQLGILFSILFINIVHN